MLPILPAVCRAGAGPLWPEPCTRSAYPWCTLLLIIIVFRIKIRNRSFYHRLRTRSAKITRSGCRYPWRYSRAQYRWLLPLPSFVSVLPVVCGVLAMAGYFVGYLLVLLVLPGPVRFLENCAVPFHACPVVSRSGSIPRGSFRLR